MSKKLAFSWYETQENSDLTEGRGSMQTRTRWISEELAVQDASHRGVMGVGTGEVIKRELYENADTGEITLTTQKVWGYRKDWKGVWGYGWADNRDAPVNDPEYKEFLRLKAKFNG